MIRRLRLKFICVNMLIVTVMMGVIFGLVYHFTQTGTGNSERFHAAKHCGGAVSP